ncbi:putative integral membrane protein, partial [Ehrlichia ruminantium]
LYNNTNANKQLKEEVDKGLLNKSLAAVDGSVSHNVSNVDDGQKTKVCSLPTILEESFSEVINESRKLITT